MMVPTPASMESAANSLAVLKGALCRFQTYTDGDIASAVDELRQHAQDPERARARFTSLACDISRISHLVIPEVTSMWPVIRGWFDGTITTSSEFVMYRIFGYGSEHLAACFSPHATGMWIPDDLVAWIPVGEYVKLGVSRDQRWMLDPNYPIPIRQRRVTWPGPDHWPMRMDIRESLIADTLPGLRNAAACFLGASISQVDVDEAMQVSRYDPFLGGAMLLCAGDSWWDGWLSGHGSSPMRAAWSLKVAGALTWKCGEGYRNPLIGSWAVGPFEREVARRLNDQTSSARLRPGFKSVQPTR